MDVAIALSLLMAEAGEGGKICTFHESPKLVDVPGLPKAGDGFLGGVGDLGRRADFVKGIDWGMSTDIDRVWDLLIEEALEQGWGPESVAAMKVVVSYSSASPHPLPPRGIANPGMYTAHALLVTTLIKFVALQRRDFAATAATAATAIVTSLQKMRTRQKKSTTTSAANPDPRNLSSQILSDMEFDEAMDGATPWETAHEATCRKFADAGLAATPPLIV